MLTEVGSSVFTNSDSITMKPVVSAEWNQNLFNPPYITVAGLGSTMPVTLSSGTIFDVSVDAKPNFITKRFSMANEKGSVSYSVTADNGRAYKIVTYVKTDTSLPIMLTAFAQNGSTAYGSSQEEVSSLGWTKIVTYIGVGQNEISGLSSFTYTINANALTDAKVNPIVYFTVPQVYQTSYSDYKYGQLWPTESVFTHFRPGESYVGTGNSNCSFPSNYRKITAPTIQNYTTPTYSAISSIVQMPSFFFASPPIPALKSSLPTDISPYKYFVSEQSGRTITGIYEKPILTNKIVIKLNTMVTIPSLSVTIDGNLLTVDGNHIITLDTNTEGYCNGLLTLYWTGTVWTKNKWSSMPTFNQDGTINQTTSISKITITQISSTPRSEFNSYTSQQAINDFERMQLIEVSPRLEIDVSAYVQSLNIEKSLDSQNSLLPISAINSNSCNIQLSGIPLSNNSQIINIFSSQSDESSTLLSSILRKNIKFYVYFNLLSYSDLSSNSFQTSNAHIPGGVFYSDSWDESDIDSISVQCFDVYRYLQSTPSPDYVANLKSVFEIVTNILDCAGFTDYNYDALYRVCNSKAMPMDISYFYCNSKDSTIVDTLNQIFLAYQVGAYIDEYGVMQFLDLYQLLAYSPSSLSISDFNIVQNGFSVSNKAKPGKVSLRYQSPKVKQSPSIQNVTNPMIKNSPSVLYATSNDVVWSQQSADSVGFNYIQQDMSKDSNVLKLNVNDLLDIFHTFNRDTNGYAFIDNEIVSFLHKEYKISNLENTKSTTVSIKNDIELQAEVNKFIKEYSIGLRTSYAQVTGASGNGTVVTYTASNSFRAGDKVSIININPSTYSLSGKVVSANANSFTIAGTVTDLYISGGDATISTDYDVLIAPTGNITNVQRGLYGTFPTDHKKITSLTSKGLSEKIMSPALNISSSSGLSSVITETDTSLPNITKLQVDALDNNTTLIYPTSEVDLSYHTYSVKFNMPDQDLCSAGLFFNMASDVDSDGIYIVELVRFNQIDPKTQELYTTPRYKYLLSIWSTANNERFYTDVTGECNSIVKNAVKIIKKTPAETEGVYDYSYVSDIVFNLKVVHYLSNGDDGEKKDKRIVSVFINNIEITGWNEEKEDDYDQETNPTGSGWKPTAVNVNTGMRQKPYFTDNFSHGTRFGFMASLVPTQIGGVYPPYVYTQENIPGYPALLREIHATQKPLKERSVSYFYQDREFLNGLVQNQPLYTNSLTYLMQTNPEVVGINYYDVQYETPAAVSVDILPIEYMLNYFPGTDVQDQRNYQKKLVDEYSLAYSTPINTGFRAKMAVANNSPHMVFLSKEADALENATVTFNLWTHEIVAPSAPEILEVVIDPSNMSEVAQLDSEWIQSKLAAQRMLKIISMGIEGFSKTATVEIFGNPLIQVGDIITLTYSLKGIRDQKYFVKSVDHSFSSGLTTRITMNRLQ